MSKLLIIYDGQCDLCKKSLAWVQQRAEIAAISYQECDLAKFGLTFAQCAKAVYVIEGEKQYSGADAVALLLKVRGNHLSAKLLTFSGAVGRSAYRWVASHRSSLLVRLLFGLLRV